MCLLQSTWAYVPRRKMSTQGEHRERCRSCVRLPVWPQHSWAKAAGDSSRHLSSESCRGTPPSLTWHSREREVCCLLGPQIRDVTEGLPHPGNSTGYCHCSRFGRTLVVQPVKDSVKVNVHLKGSTWIIKMGRSVFWKEFLFCIYGDPSISLAP